MARKKKLTPIEPTPATALAKLQLVVKHLIGAWPGVLQRREFLRRMAQSDTLRKAFENTYSAHVFNAMHGAFSSDLIRCIGAFVLDRDPESISVALAVGTLSRPDVIAQLQSKVYDGVTSTETDDPAKLTALRRLQRADYQSIIDGLPAELQQIKEAILTSTMASTLWTFRCKLIAHAAMELDGATWKVWTIDGIKLTYSELDEYIDKCTEAIDLLSHRILRQAYSFDDQPSRDQLYADEYIEALIKGLTLTKREREQRLQENLQWIARLTTNEKDQR
jgi:hypothetical protein